MILFSVFFFFSFFVLLYYCVLILSNKTRSINRRTVSFTDALMNTSSSPSLNSDVQSALVDAVPVLLQLVQEFGLESILQFNPQQKPEPLITNFMDVNWQYNDPPNPRDAAIGPQAYDNHLYYSFGGVAAANEAAYLTSICNLNRIQADAALGDSPLWFGEWGLPTQFNATNEFLFKWADAQKLAYSQGAGWLFWNFKVERSQLAGDLGRQWSYLEGVELGYLTKDPSKVNDPHVCDAYVNSTQS